MGKVRVYELAQELQLNNKDLVELLQKVGADVKNHMSSVDDTLANRIRASVSALRERRAQAQAGTPASAASKATTTPATPAAPATASAPEATPAVAKAATVPKPVAAPKVAVPAAQAAVTAAKAPDRKEASPAITRGTTPGITPTPRMPAEQAPGATSGTAPGKIRPSVPATPPPAPRTASRPPQAGSGPGGTAPMRDRDRGAGQYPGGNQARRGHDSGRGPAVGRPPGERGHAGSVQPAVDRGFGPGRGTADRGFGAGRPAAAPGYGQKPPARQGVSGGRWGGRDGAPVPGGRFPAAGRGGVAGGRGPAVAVGRPGVRGERGFDRGERGGRGARGVVDIQRRRDEREEESKLLAKQGRRRQVGRPAEKPAAVKRGPVVLPPQLTVKELAGKLGVDGATLIKKFMTLGLLVTINQSVEADAAQLVAEDLGFEVTVEVPKDLEEMYLADAEDDPASLKERPPVVTVMGHVDHGKTSLLDAIRETKVAAGEAGGITQHIGAYQVEIKGKKITFLDTPGHEAFTAMRARGAQVTDIAVLVVAADDGVMPQTVEAINHAKAAGVPIIVAINKIDKPNANPDRVKQELTEYGLLAEDWGGDTICVPVSALRKQGIDDLLENILLVAEMRELVANPDRKARGVVIESQLDKGRGPVATVLVQKGTLRVGDSIVAGTVAGRVRAMTNDKGKSVKKAGPSMPVEVVGLADVPQAGDVFVVTDEEKAARLVAESRKEKQREEMLKKTSRVSLEDLFSKIKEGEVKVLNVVLKADVHGSVEAIKQSLTQLSNDEVRVNVIHAGVGAITESDVMLAAASNAIIIGFNVRPDSVAKRIAEREQVDIRTYRIIYEAIDDVKAAMTGMLEPEYKEAVIGRAEVRATFRVPKVGVVAGSYVTDGKITRSASVRVLRDHVVIHEGAIESLKRFKDDVREVSEGFECGIGLANFNDIKEGDVIEAYVMEEVKREAK